jgi:hypothetical protein
MVATGEALSVPPSPVPAITVEEGQTAAEAVVPHVALEPPAEAGPGSGDVVVVLDEDLARPPSSGGHDVMMTPMSEPAPAAVTTNPSSGAEVLEPSPTAEVSDPSPAVGAVKTSSAAGTVTVEEVMELATSRYIDFPGVGVIDLVRTRAFDDRWMVAPGCDE